MKQALAFFGAFNPPTVAHLGLAEMALRLSGREKALFVPSQSVYIEQNQGKDFAYSDEARLAMLRAAAKSRPWMEVIDWELSQPRQPRTYRTLCHLKEEGWQAALLIGSDKLAEMERGWLHVPEIAAEFGIVCLSRGQDDCKRLLRENAFFAKLAPHIQVIDSPESTRNVSSTQVRKRVFQIKELEKELRTLVPEEILPLL